MFLISSSRFRRETKDRILFWRRKNYVQPNERPVDGIAMQLERNGLNHAK